ncbi:MAG: hypothetical protein ABW116_01450 [Candidatus Sedimenticola sp. 20ELBAFRAG]
MDFKILLALAAVVLGGLTSGCSADPVGGEVSSGNTSHLPGKKVDGVHHFPACLIKDAICMKMTVKSDSTFGAELHNYPLDLFENRSGMSGFGLTRETHLPKGVYMVGL